MLKTLPPLSSLRSFEAVARHLSFSKAAEELHVTPGAISQQIRSLEVRVGARLFDRTKRSVALTDVAARILPDVQAGLETLARAVSSKIPAIGERTLTISVAPSFASKWLLPRLPSFYDQHADIDLRISATVALADFNRDSVDLAIRLGHGNYPGLHADPLFAEALTPLCSPELLKRKGPLKRPDDLRRHRLIHDTSIPAAASTTPGGSGSAWLAQSTSSPIAATGLPWPSMPCRRPLTVWAWCSGASFWLKKIWRRAGSFARLRPHCRWTWDISWLVPMLQLPATR